MGALVRVLIDACRDKVDEVAQEIEGEMKGIVGGHSRSGMAVGAIHIENTGEFSRFVGGTGGEGTMHLYYLNEGNGGGRIYPRTAKALWLSDYGIWRGSVRTYEGIHFVEKIAARHGG